MKEENAGLLQPLMVSKIDVEEICTTDWEGAFKPCPFSEAKKLMDRMKKDGSQFPSPDLMTTLKRLQESNTIVMDHFGAEDTQLIRIYPPAVKDIACLFIENLDK